MKQHVTLSDRIAAVTQTGAERFAAGSATTSSGFWFCDVYLDGRVYCNVANLNSQEEAEWRARAIAKALNAAPPEAFK